MFGQIVSAVTVLLLGALGWIALEFIGRPLRNFFDLRREILRKMVFLANVEVSQRSMYLSFEDQTKINEERAVALEAQRALRDLGAQAIAFSEGEPFSMLILRMLRIDAFEAGKNLVGLSNNVSEQSPERTAYRAAVQKALRFYRIK